MTAILAVFFCQKDLFGQKVQCFPTNSFVRKVLNVVYINTFPTNSDVGKVLDVVYININYYV